MKHARLLLPALTLLVAALSHATQAKNITTFIPRSQGANTARELVGWQRQLYKCYDENYAAIAPVAEYTHSMHTESLAKKLFSTTCLTFTGSERTDRASTDLLADYFGLPVDFKGTLAIKPRIENFIIDLELYFGMDQLSNGLFLRIHAPITHTRWTLGLDACVVCADKFRGCPTFPGCYMSSTPLSTTTSTSITPSPCSTISSTSPVGCPIDAALNPLYQNNVDCATTSLREALSGNFTFGDMKEPWHYGRFDFCSRDKTGLADIDAIMGYNFLHNDYAHFGAFVMTVIPTGNRPKAKYIFEPIVGNGKHWELGGGFTTHISLGDYCEKTNLNLGVYIEGNITHVFSTHQTRSFDFTQNGLLSRYMLLKEFDPVCSNGIFQGTYMYNFCQQFIPVSAPAVPNVPTSNPPRRNHGLMNAINFATRNCEVHVGLKADVSAKVCVTKGGWTLDAGYNFWYRSEERICIKTDCPCYLDSRFLGFKGTEPVCCTSYQIANVPGTTGQTSIIIPVPPQVTTIEQFPANAEPRLAGCPDLQASNPNNGLPYNGMSEPANGTQPDATIYAGGTPANGPILPTDCSVCLAGNQITTLTPISELTPAEGFLNDMNVQPVFISCADLDPHSAEQGRMMTHKVFGHLSYTWYRSCYSPHLGIGGEAEFDAHCDNALEQWGIWLKGGLEF